jgi:hypothetical protein
MDIGTVIHPILQGTMVHSEIIDSRDDLVFYVTPGRAVVGYSLSVSFSLMNQHMGEDGYENVHLCGRLII